jgi:hypothetical protein
LHRSAMVQNLTMAQPGQPRCISINTGAARGEIASTSATSVVEDNNVGSIRLHPRDYFPLLGVAAPSKISGAGSPATYR